MHLNTEMNETSESSPKESATNLKNDANKENSSTEIAESNEISDEKRKEVTMQAINLLAQGKRNLLCQEINSAVEQFQESSKLLASVYGETAKECAESYLCYGQALLMLARMENTVLGNALQGVPTEEEGAVSADEQFETTENIDSQERLDLRIQVCEAMEVGVEADVSVNAQDEEMLDENESKVQEGEIKIERNSSDQLVPEDTKEVKDGETSEGLTNKDEGAEDTKVTPDNDENPDRTDSGKDDVTKQDTTVDVNQDETTANDDDADEDESSEGDDADASITEQENPDDISNFQLAWEMLELARIIYMKSTEDKMRLRAADACMMLGEISLETEQYEKAIEDITQCLNIQKSILEFENRLIAETHYQLGLAYLLNAEHKNSLEHLETAVFVIKQKIGKLRKLIEEESNKDIDLTNLENPIVKAQIEIKDLEEILPEIKTKIDDVKEEMKSYDAIKCMAKEAFSAAVGSLSDGLSENSSVSNSEEKKPVNDISHLIRKRRKPEDVEPAEAQQTPEAKRYCGEAGDSLESEAEEKTDVVNGIGDVCDSSTKSSVNCVPSQTVADADTTDAM